MRERFHFSFTPSLLPSEALEALFVQREDLAERIVELIHESTISDAKHYFLLIGPRGIGKTHMVSLLYHRIKAITEIQDKLVIAWLQEDSWGISSLLDLLIQILQSLVKESGDGNLLERIDRLFEMAPEHAEQAAGRLLKEYVSKRTLFLIIENLDELFEGLGDIGQKRLRAYLQENPYCTILATSSSLFNGVSLQTSPFYGFFSIHHLAEFEFDHALDFLIRIARYKNDRRLTSFLRTPHGRARVRAVHHLAGGNPRVYTIFAQFLNRVSMERLVEPFMRAMDDLTPYYQARMKHLSLQQRKIIELLCDRRGAITVKEIAQRCFISHQTASSQLKLLREMRYVKATTIGRESYYELNEPLMRISLEVKKHRGEPLRLFVEFLRCWYTRTELENLLEVSSLDAKIELQYIRQALTLSKEGSEDPRIASCQKDLEHYQETAEYDKAFNVLDELEALEGVTYSYLVERGHILTEQEKYEEAILTYKQAIELDETEAYAWFGIGYNYLNLKKYEECLRAYDKAIELGMVDSPIWGLRGICLQSLGLHEQAVQSFNKVIELDPNDDGGWAFMGQSLLELGRYLEAADAFANAFKLDKSNHQSLVFQFIALISANKIHNALSLGQEHDAILSNNKLYVGTKALALSSVGRDVEALHCWQGVIDLGDHSSFIRIGKVGSLIALQRWDEAKTILNEAIGISREEKQPQPVSSVLILEKLFNANQDVEYWRNGISLLVSSHAEHNELSALAASLVRSISHILSTRTSDSIAVLWRDQWKSASSEFPEMSLPIRLLDTAIEYRKNKDQRILMELPIEERKILEEILDEIRKKSEDNVE
jgi:tetratricopeptide (TPR) repeat protein